ncbi:MAG TPA: hypothetical protein VMM55_12960, partial [Thermohalobaculum sp.]|nr:hypothetical protein [Thermohalobaculum sp.]
LLFALVVAGALIGPGFDPDSNDPLWALLAGLVLAGLHAARLPLADLAQARTAGPPLAEDPHPAACPRRRSRYGHRID